MNAKRLLTLARFLRIVPPERFNYRWWVTSTGPHWGDGEEPRLPCGTAGCAGGWATAVPEFARAGLELVIDVPRFGKHFGLDAVAYFFELTSEGASFLFEPEDVEYHAAPSYVADKIEEFVREGSP